MAWAASSEKADDSHLTKINHFCNGSYAFSGTLRDDEGNDHDVGGEDTVTVSSRDPLVAWYDTNKDGMIDKPEVIAAFRAYVADPSDKTEMIAIFRQYVADTAGSQ